MDAFIIDAALQLYVIHQQINGYEETNQSARLPKQKPCNMPNQLIPIKYFFLLAQMTDFKSEL